MIVLDVGSATHGSDSSIPYLIETFKPETLYGFDPAEPDADYLYGGATVLLKKAAAWTYDGSIGFVVAGLGGHVAPGSGNAYRCVDLARFILDVASEGEEVVLKIDAEGAEYTLIPHLVAHGADLFLKLALIEWHCADCGIGGNGRHREGCKGDHVAWTKRREIVEGLLRCPTEEWSL